MESFRRETGTVPSTSHRFFSAGSAPARPATSWRATSHCRSKPPETTPSVLDCPSDHLFFQLHDRHTPAALLDRCGGEIRDERVRLQKCRDGAAELTRSVPVDYPHRS